MQKTLIMCQGLPGSGKTTWAQNEVVADPDYPAGVVRVNKDDIRLILAATGWVWSHRNEKDVVAERDRRINSAFKMQAHTVISDDTNFGRKHRVALEALARANDARFQIKTFDTPIEECIRRDALRPKPVGEAVIRRMAAQQAESTQEEQSIPPLVQVPGAPTVILCDLDGTLSLFERKGHRGPYDASLCDQDEVNEPVLLTLRALNSIGFGVTYLSGRFDTYKQQTHAFLSTHNCPIGPLYMRKAGDTRKDYIAKRELFDAHIRGQYNVLFVLDDRNQVVDMWRALGLTCFQVAPGNF